jgi:predicted Holliday junction resolvase-like endonuclease
MNYREQHIKKKYEAEGWKVLRNGAPDFIMLKLIDGKIVDMLAVEVKSPKDKLHYEQKVYRDILAKAGVQYKMEVVE